MRKATQEDKNLIIGIMSESFDVNPSVNWTVKQDGKREKRYRRLAGYVFDIAIRKEAIYISSNNMGVVILYKFNEHKDGLYEAWIRIKMAIRVIGLGRVREILKREAYIKSKRTRDGEYLYVWFYGVLKKARGVGENSAAVELKDFVFEQMEKRKLPVLLETTIPLNMKIYDRYGFRCYHEWKVKEKGITFWMMRKENEE